MLGNDSAGIGNASANATHPDLEAGKPLQNGYNPYQTGGYNTQQHQSDFVPTATVIGTDPVGGHSSHVSNDAAIESYEVAVRHGFIRKVLGIVAVQLLVSFGWTMWVSVHEPTRVFMLQNAWVMYIGLVGSFGTMLVLVCSSNLARVHPTNLILLGVFTLCETLLLGGVSASLDDTTVLATAIGTTMAIVVVLVLFAMQTKYDFTGMGPYLCVALMCMLLYSFIASIFGGGTGTIYAAFGALLFSCYLVYDVQLVVGGRHRKYEIGIDDYVMAALAIYLDIINLFLYILRLLQDRN